MTKPTHECQIKPVKPNLSSKYTKPNLQNQAYQTIPTKLILPNQTYQTKGTKAKRQN